VRAFDRFQHMSAETFIIAFDVIDVVFSSRPLTFQGMEISLKWVYRKLNFKKKKQEEMISRVFYKH